MVSDARLDAANALVRAVLVLLGTHRPEFRLTVFSAGATSNMIGTDIVGNWRWVDLQTEPGVIASLEDGLESADEGSPVVLITDESGREALSFDPVATFVVRGAGGSPRPGAVVHALTGEETAIDDR